MRNKDADTELSFKTTKNDAKISMSSGTISAKYPSAEAIAALSQQTEPVTCDVVTVEKGPLLGLFDSISHLEVERDAGWSPDAQSHLRKAIAFIRMIEPIRNTAPQSGVRDGQPRFFRGLEIVDSAAPQFSPQDAVSVPREPSWELQLAIRDKVGISPNQILECLAMLRAAQEGKK